MTTQRSLVAWTGVLLLAMTTELIAQSRGSSNEGSTPNGRPFQQIQSQFDAMNQRIIQLQVQINSVEAKLQAQIDGINELYAPLQNWIDSVDTAIASLNSRMDADQAMIAAHQAAVGALQASLVSVETELAWLQNQVASYGSSTDANTSAVLALQAQVAELKALINEHAGQIAALQGQVNSIDEFLTAMVDASCAVGEAISDVGVGGKITCLASGGVDLVATQLIWNFGPNVLRTFELDCPAGYKAVSGGYDGAYGMSVVSAFPKPTSFVIRVQSPLVNSAIQVIATCVK